MPLLIIITYTWMSAAIHMCVFICCVYICGNTTDDNKTFFMSYNMLLPAYYEFCYVIMEVFVPYHFYWLKINLAIYLRLHCISIFSLSFKILNKPIFNLCRGQLLVLFNVLIERIINDGHNYLLFRVSLVGSNSIWFDPKVDNGTKRQIECEHLRSHEIMRKTTQNLKI